MDMTIIIKRKDRIKFRQFCMNYDLVPVSLTESMDTCKFRVELSNRSEEHFKTVEASRIMYKTDNEIPGITILTRGQLEAYCIASHGSSAMEEGHLICIDCQGRVILNFTLEIGDLGEVAMMPAKIAKVALLANAHAVFLSHNHPGGICKPSAEDIISTRHIQQVLFVLGIRLLDHIIVTSDGKAYSMAQHGDIDASICDIIREIN